MKRYQLILITIGILCSLVSLWPLAAYRIVTAGAIIPFLAGILMAVYGGMREKLRTTRAGVIADGIILGAAAAVVCVFLVLSALMLFGPKRPKELNDQTVIVLGCKVNGTTPSLMLSRRLDTAYELLEKAPELRCVVSGGQGPDEEVSEASVMKDYLVEKGIDSDRIYIEDQSFDTQQNLDNAKQVIQQNGLSEEVIVVTDFFHEYRGQLYAKNAGLSPSGVACKTKLDLLPFYWIRETAGVGLALLGK